jgi:hypothetical protein
MRRKSATIILVAVWMVWQLDLPERGEGMAQAFRRPATSSESILAKLHGLEPDAMYAIATFDMPGATQVSGRQLMEVGLSVVNKNRPGAVIVTYQKKP